MYKIFKIFAVFLILLLFSVACCVRFVDRSPYQQSGYYKNTVERLDKVMAALPPSDSGALSVGAGRAGLTPPVGTPLAGYGNRKGAPSTGVNDSLYVRAIALQSGDRLACIIGYDALLCHPAIARIIEDSARSQLGLDAGQLLFTATHTHSGPGGWGHGWVEEQFSGPKDSRVECLFVDSTLAALKRALAQVKPASYQVGTISASQFIRNRLVGDNGRVDPDLIYLAFSRDTSIIAVFATYSAHATVLPGQNLLFSGDYPGFFAQKLESITTGTVIFAAAGIGSHSNRGQGTGFDRAKYIGHGLADSILAHLYNSGSQTCTLQYFRSTIDINDLQIRLSDNLRLAPWLARRFFHIQDAYVQAIMLDRFLIIGSPAEFSGELALMVKEHARSKGLAVTITSFNGCYLGYVTPSAYDRLSTYETRLMSFFGPNTGDYFVAIMNRIVDKVSLK